MAAMLENTHSALKGILIVPPPGVFTPSGVYRVRATSANASRRVDRAGSSAKKQVIECRVEPRRNSGGHPDSRHSPRHRSWSKCPSPRGVTIVLRLMKVVGNEDRLPRVPHLPSSEDETVPQW